MVKNSLLSDFQDIKKKIANQKQFEQELIKIEKKISEYSRIKNSQMDTLIFDWLVVQDAKYVEKSRVFDTFNQAYQIVMQKEFYMQSAHYRLNVSYPQLLKIFNVCIKLAENAAFQ